jgi:hypothetical protein
LVAAGPRCAASRIFNPRRVPITAVAEWNSAIRQIKNLRYDL